MIRTILVFAISLLLTIAQAVADITPKTSENLQSAFNIERNAQSRFEAFAKKADEEGFAKAASLFRAAARSAEIQAANHAKVIKKLGAVPQAQIETPVVKSTRENIESGIKADKHQSETMYPEFWNRARSDDDSAAMRTFTFALSAEREQARLFADALNTLDSTKGQGETYFVCTTCGYVTKKLNSKSCPSCKGPENGYETVK
jgi:rubrerythrin